MCKKQPGYDIPERTHTTIPLRAPTTTRAHHELSGGAAPPLGRRVLHGDGGRAQGHGGVTQGRAAPRVGRAPARLLAISPPSLPLPTTCATGPRHGVLDLLRHRRGVCGLALFRLLLLQLLLGPLRRRLALRLELFPPRGAHHRGLAQLAARHVPVHCRGAVHLRRRPNRGGRAAASAKEEEEAAAAAAEAEQRAAR